MMKRIAGLTLLSLLCLASPHAQQSDYQTLKKQAEKLFSDGSYGLAHELYLKADSFSLAPVESRWVKFRVADTLWRSQAGTHTSDSTKYERARQQLELLVRDISRVEDRDQVWAEVQESLGDFWWTRADSKNWSQAWNHYQQALDWWAGSPDIESARARYLKIVWTAAKPSWSEPYYYYGYYGNVLPLDVLENTLRIARSPNDKAHSHYLLAMTLRQQGGDWDQRQRVPEEFEAALSAGKTTDWYDDALYHYAEWLTNYGRVVPLEDGQWKQEYDYTKALELFRRLISDHAKGETRYYDQARQQIETITRPTVQISASNIFLPESEIQFDLSWRNVKKINIALYGVDLTRDVHFSGKDVNSGGWLQQIKLPGRKPLKSWLKETGDKGDYKPGQEAVHLDTKLPVGAYVVEATAGREIARDLILVTDASLVLKTSAKQALVYFCNALNGSPLSSANVSLWERSYNGHEWAWRQNTAETNKDGLAFFDLGHPQNSVELFAAATADNRQAFSIAYGYSAYSESQPWRIYAFTDRPAYRPSETAQWKLVARKYDGSSYSTPANETIEFEIKDPRAAKVYDGRAKLNAFGSAWGSLTLTESMPLGEYRVTFWDEGRRKNIGTAVLFRIEEYKLPEFKVTVATPEENGKKKAFRLGEKVEVSVQAEYYFGGPVTNATVEVLVYQNPFYHWWNAPRDFPWYYEDMTPQRYYWGGRGQVIKRETLKSDATGKASLTLESPRNQGQDLEYYIEARVTDSSRREIVGSDTIRVTRHRYYVYPRAAHYLYRPHDKVNIDIKSIDANDQPVQVEGKVKVTRDYWYEVWLDPNGKEVKGEELRKLREKNAVFPPATDVSSRPWQLKFRGYQHDGILSQTVTTDAEGQAEFSFTPEREGFYRVSWTSEDKGAAAVTAETTVWLATNATTELGYRHGGLEIIVDRDTFRAGQKAAVMLTAPTSDRYVLFSVEGEKLYSYQLLHLTGTVKLIELSLQDDHVPNIFLSAAMVSDRQLFMDTKQVVVPPVEHFLSVDVKPDREQYQTREPGTFVVTTRDNNGKPVSAEVAFGLTDESVYYIQQDYAGDPRRFYYGAKRQQHVNTTSTFQYKGFARLVEGANKRLIDDREFVSQYGSGGGLRADIKDSDRLARGSIAETVSVEEVGAAKAINAPVNARDNIARLQPGVAAEMPAAPPAGREPAVQVRSDFRTTVLWQPDVVTNKDGRAIVKVKYPDSLTKWRASARAATEGNQFGVASAATRTRQPLMVRLQAPRFFVVGDLVTVSAVINNSTDQAMSVSPSLAADGVVVSGVVVEGKLVKGELAPVEVMPNSEARVDWLVSAQHASTAKLKVTARGSKYADAMERNFVVHEHGIEKFVAKSGKLRGDEVTIRLDIPKERKAESTRLSVQLAPSMAVTMLDALPYLIDYPYGCTEQTMSRFLPAAITAKTLKNLGLKPEDVMERVFGGIVQENAGNTHRGGKKDLHELDEMVKQGLDRLYNFQHPDGGWGWWKEGDSDHFMTAYVVWGLALASDAGIELKPEVPDRGVAYLDKEIVEEEENYDQQAWILHALAAYHMSSKQTQVGSFQKKAFENLWANRDRLNAYTRALLALSAHYFGYTENAQTLIRNLENGVKIDSSPDTSVVQQGKQTSEAAVIGTAHWGEDGIYWRWSDGGIEATSFALRALLAIDPKNKLVEPVTNWLIKNRRGAQWSNTRDTAITVLTLNEYLHFSGELAPEIEYDLFVNGSPIVSRKLTAEDAFTAPSQFKIDSSHIRDGVNEIRIRRKSGVGPVYFAAQAQFFSQQEPVSAAGNEIFVRREYYRMIGRPTLLKGHVYERQPLGDGETVTSGERVEVVMTIEAKNNYEYLVFEDLKPAGLEAVQLRSGEPLHAKELKSSSVERRFGGPGERPAGEMTAGKGAGGDLRSATAQESTWGRGSLEQSDYTGRTRWVYQELRDRKVALFIDKLPQGTWEIRYDLRAEVPGRFHALPVLGQAMYVPEIRCNGVETRINIEDAK